MTAAGEDYRHLWEKMPEAFVHLWVVFNNDDSPTDYIILAVNQAFATLAELIQEELLGKSIQTLISHSTGKGGFNWQSLHETLAGTEQPAHSLAFYDQRNKRLYEIITWSDQPGFLTAIFLDVTEKKSKVEKLRENELRFRSLVTAMESALMVEDSDRNIVLTNQAFCDFFAIPASPEALIGTNCSDAAEQAKELIADPDHFPRRIKEIISKRKLVLGEEILFANGKTYERDYIPVFAIDKSFVGHMWQYRDITERKQAEDALQQEKAFQAILLELATIFINVPLVEFDRAINDMLKKTGEFTGLDRAYLFRHDHQRRVTSNTHEWCREGIAPEIDNLQNIPFDDFFEWWEAWEKGEIVHIPSVAKMPKELATRAILEQQGIQSLVVIPIVENRMLTGFVGFDAVNESKSFTEQEITLLRVLAEIISNAFTRRDTELKLETLKSFNESIVQNITEGIIISDLEGNVTFANQTLLNMLGYSNEEFLGSHWSAAVPAEYQHLVEAADARRLAGKADRYELIFSHKSGALLPFQVSGSPYHDHVTGKVVGTVAVLTDISDRKKAEEVLKASEERIRLMTRNIKDVVVETDANGYYTYISESGPNVLGYGQELIGKRTFDYIHPDDVEQVLLSFAKVSGSNETARVEYRFRHPERGYIWVEGTGGTYQNNSNETMVLVTIRDITERKQTEDEMRYMSLHDRLTGLYNRYFFEGELRRYAGSREHPIAIVLTDFDGLKLINDTLGHSAGDSYLIAGARVLSTALRSSDILARVGGDEFALLLPRTNREDGEKLVARIRQSISSYNQATAGLPLSISIGLAVCENSNTSLEDTYRSADGAMYQDKFERSKNARNAIVDFLMTSLHDRDQAAKEVAEQVEKLSVKVGQALNFNESLLSRLELLARLRDLGNITLSGQLLQKSGALTEKETELIRQHAETGYRIFSSSPDPELAGVADLVLKHHENFDGTGYPLGLKGDDIPIECRIVAVCAAYCAMINPRPYARTFTPEEASAELQRYAGTQFDPVVVEMFIDKLANDSNATG